MDDQEALQYLTELVQNRTESIRHSGISDEHLRDELAGHEEKLYHSLETSVFTSLDNYLGQGMTAKVKLYQLQTHERTLPLAIKYVVTPTEKTLTAEQEHNAIKEVERLRIIEAAEIVHERRSRFIRVPHPYLHHTTEAVQLYGMEYIDGITLEQACAEGRLHTDMREAIKTSQLATISEEELNGYIRRFFETMHQYCLHGDIKPKNIMISREGILYVIDFGQSFMVHNIPASAEENLENLKEDEIKQTQAAVRIMLRKVFEE